MVDGAEARSGACGGSGAEDSGGTTVLVMAKEPVPGRVKTRLSPPYTPHQAARLAEAALADTLALLAALPARRRVLVLAGQPGEWLPDGFEVVPQSGDGLDARMAAALALCEGPALLLGMDTPQLTRELLWPVLAPDAWAGCDAWFGPAVDGGFWALGLAAPDPELVRGVPMSVAETGGVQRRRLVDAGLAVRDLPRLRDVDTPGDAAAIAALCEKEASGVRFAEEFARASAELRPEAAR